MRNSQWWAEITSSRVRERKEERLWWLDYWQVKGGGQEKSLKCGSRQRRLKRLISSHLAASFDATLINNLTNGEAVRLLKCSLLLKYIPSFLQTAFIVWVCFLCSKASPEALFSTLLCCRHPVVFIQVLVLVSTYLFFARNCCFNSITLHWKRWCLLVITVLTSRDSDWITLIFLSPLNPRLQI